MEEFLYRAVKRRWHETAGSQLPEGEVVKDSEQVGLHCWGGKPVSPSLPRTRQGEVRGDQVHGGGGDLLRGSYPVWINVVVIVINSSECHW